MGTKLMLIALLFGHLISMQIAAAGPLVSAWLEWRGQATMRDDTAEAGRRIAWQSIYGLVIGVVLGLVLVVAAMMVGTRDYTNVVSRFYSRVWWGGWELVTSLVVMLIYVLRWKRLRQSTIGRCCLRFLAFFSATNLLYHFPPLMTVLVESLESEVITQSATATVSEVTSSEFRALIFRHEVLAKSLHFGFAGLAACGASLLWTSRGSTAADVDADRPTHPPDVRWGSWMTVVAIAMQMLVGMWLVVLSPPSVQSQLMGKNPLVAVTLIGGILLSLMAMNQAASIGMGDAGRPKLTAVTVVAVIALMVSVTGLTTSGW